MQLIARKAAYGKCAPLLDVFCLRCEARALLVREGAMSANDAVAGLQQAAEAYGLVAVIGRDIVDAIIADAFAVECDEPGPGPDLEIQPERCCDICGHAPCMTPGFCSYSRRADQDPKVRAEREHSLSRLLANWGQMDFGALYGALNERVGVAKSTLDAAEYLIKENDPKRFRAWLLQRSPAERADIVAHINKIGDRSC